MTSNIVNSNSSAAATPYVCASKIFCKIDLIEVVLPPAFGPVKRIFLSSAMVLTTGLGTRRFQNPLVFMHGVLLSTN